MTFFAYLLLRKSYFTIMIDFFLIMQEHYLEHSDIARIVYNFPEKSVTIKKKCMYNVKNDQT